MAFEDRVREILDDYLRDPLAFPEEFRSWVPEWTQTVGIVTPRSSVTGLYTTGDSIGDLGEPAHGRPCMLRLGASAPYDFVQMTFDEVAGLWVSTSTWDGSQIASHNTSGTSYADVPSTMFCPVQVPSLAAAVAAGLRPQVFVSCQFAFVGASEEGYLRAAIYEYTDGDTSLSLVGTGGEITTATNNAYKASGWSDVTWSPTPSEANGYIVAQTKHVTGSVGPAAMNIAFRWVADPA